MANQLLFHLLHDWEMMSYEHTFTLGFLIRYIYIFFSTKFACFFAILRNEVATTSRTALFLSPAASIRVPTITENHQEKQCNTICVCMHYSIQSEEYLLQHTLLQQYWHIPLVTHASPLGVMWVLKNRTCKLLKTAKIHDLKNTVLCSIPCQSIGNLWWTIWHSDSFSPHSSFFPSASFQQCSTFIYISIMPCKFNW